MTKQAYLGWYSLPIFGLCKRPKKSHVIAFFPLDWAGIIVSKCVSFYCLTFISQTNMADISVLKVNFIIPICAQLLLL